MKAEFIGTVRDIARITEIFAQMKAVVSTPYNTTEEYEAKAKRLDELVEELNKINDKYQLRRMTHSFQDDRELTREGLEKSAEVLHNAYRNNTQVKKEVDRITATLDCPDVEMTLEDVKWVDYSENHLNEPLLTNENPERPLLWLILAITGLLIAFTIILMQ